MIDEIADAAGLLDRAMAVATDLGSRPREAFRLTKRQLREPFIDRARKFSTADREAMELWSSPKTHEAIRAYLSKTVGRKS